MTRQSVLRSLLRRGGASLHYRLLPHGIALLLGPAAYQAHQKLIEHRPMGESDTVRRAARDICEGWYEGLDCAHRDVSLGWVAAYKLAGELDILSRSAIVHEVASLWRSGTGRTPPGTIISGSVTPHFAELVLRKVARHSGDRVIALLPDRLAVRRFRSAQADRYAWDRDSGFEIPLAEADVAGEDSLRVVPKASVVFFASLESYLTPLIPVMNAMPSDQPVCVVVPRVARQDWLRFRDVPDTASVVYLDDLFDSTLEKVLSEATVRYSRLWEASSSDLRQRFVVRDVDLWDELEPGVRHIVEDYMPFCAAYVEMAHRLIAQVQPRAVVGARLRRGIDRAFLGMAGRQNVPTVLVTHGEIAGRSRDTFFNMAGFSDVDRVCVWGEGQKREILEELPGVPLGHIVITGNPSHDDQRRAMEVPKGQMRARIAEALGIEDRYGTWVVYTTHSGNSAFLFRAIQEALLAIPDGLLVVKLHPDESPAFYYDNLLETARDRVVIVEHGDAAGLFNLFRASDIVMTRFSSTALDALAAGIPLMLVDVDPELRRRLPERFDFGRYGVVVPKDQTSLNAALHRFATDSRARQEASQAVRLAQEDVLGAIDGGAARRVVRVISEAIAVS